MPYISRRHIRRHFNPELPLYAQCELTEGGEVYEQGEEFPWKDLGLDERAIMTLFRVRKLSHHPQGDILASAPQEPVGEETTDPDDLDDSDDVDNEFDDSDVEDEEVNEEESDEESEEGTEESSEEEDSDEE